MGFPITLLNSIIQGAYTIPYLNPEGQQGGTGMPTTNPVNPAPSDSVKGIRTDFLFWEAAVLGGIIAAPVIYRAYAGTKRGRRGAVNENIALALDNASARSVALLASIGPAIGFPMAYMSVQCLEQRGVITKGLGDTVQSLMALAAGGQAASAIGGLLQTVAMKGIK